MEKNEELIGEIKLLLKAILITQIKIAFPNDKNEVNKAEVVRFFHANGFQPSEIAPIVGKKKATEIAPYLYPKRKK